jgi:hypothetical protein
VEIPGEEVVVEVVVNGAPALVTCTEQQTISIGVASEVVFAMIAVTTLQVVPSLTGHQPLH